MKPIAILQHEVTQGPGILGEYLQQQSIPFDVIAPCPDFTRMIRASDYRGLVVLGSNHCANDQLRWIEQERCLLQDALSHDVPVLGHCFGAQMLARAMGASVRRNPCPNIGWSRVWVTRQAKELLQLPRDVTFFNWHYDTFSIPRGAIRSMYGSFCLNKGFVHGRNWAFQGHLEVTEQSVKTWCSEGRGELSQVRGPSVQNEMQILSDLPHYIDELHATALHVYSSWTRQLDRPLSVHLGSLAHSSLSPVAKISAQLRLKSNVALQYQAPFAEKTKAILARAFSRLHAGHKTAS